MNRPSIDNLNQDVQEYIITLETSLEEQKTRIVSIKFPPEIEYSSIIISFSGYARMSPHESVIESAKADMLSRSVEERFSISTGNYFNVSTDWDFDTKGTAAIEATKQWYRWVIWIHKEKQNQEGN